VASRNLTSQELVRAAAHNHRAWFRRGARGAGGSIEIVGGADLMIDGRHGTVPFPARVTDLDAIMDRIRAAGLRQVGWWSTEADVTLGTSLVARGFGWGWQPHWMARKLEPLPDPLPAHSVARSEPPYAGDLPYAPNRPDSPCTIGLGVRIDGTTVGYVAINPWHRIAGIYSMGVSAAHRRQGIGRALTVAACRLAAEQGCTYAVLNATEDGERLYSTLGFESRGWGQSWWWFPGAIPTPRQTAIAEAIGHGELDKLRALKPTVRELTTRLPGDTSPLRLAVIADQLDTADWMLDRAPKLASSRFEPFGGTLLHLAVEWERPELIKLALARGVDPTVRDRAFNGTPFGWAQHFEHADLTALLAP
jgi:ribosomal protein S18 acetylase RimI-like enzyme